MKTPSAHLLASLLTLHRTLFQRRPSQTAQVKLHLYRMKIMSLSLLSVCDIAILQPKTKNKYRLSQIS
jgi:hypothetical protein